MTKLEEAIERLKQWTDMDDNNAMRADVALLMKDYLSKSPKPLSYGEKIAGNNVEIVLKRPSGGRICIWSTSPLHEKEPRSHVVVSPDKDYLPVEETSDKTRSLYEGLKAILAQSLDEAFQKGRESRRGKLEYD